MTNFSEFFRSFVASYSVVLLATSLFTTTAWAQENTDNVTPPPRELSTVIEAYQRQLQIAGISAHAPNAESMRYSYMSAILLELNFCQNQNYERNATTNSMFPRIGSFMPLTYESCVVHEVNRNLSGQQVLFRLAEHMPLDEVLQMFSPLINRESLAQLIVTYLLPQVVEGVEQISPAGRSTIRNLLTQLQMYARNLHGAELAAEMDYAQYHPRSFNRCTRDIASAQPNGECLTANGEYLISNSVTPNIRKAQTFLYRRIVAGLPQQFIVNSLQRFIDIL